MINLRVGCLMLALSGAASAADLVVEVRDREGGGPLAGVAVCLGTSANSSQFGAQRTGEDGRARFSNLLASSQVLTISGDGFRGVRRTLEPRDVDRVIQVDLTTGGGGPRCAAPGVSAGSGEAGLTVTAFSLNGGASATANRDVRLSHRVDGVPTHFRVSESPAFKDAEWRDYEAEPSYRLSDDLGASRA